MNGRSVAPAAGESADRRPPLVGPLFVVGSMRSGSTMLRLILDSHPEIAISPETGFMGALLATKTIPNWKNGKDWYRRLDWTDEEFDDRLREFYAGMFERYAAAQGKRRWGEKTPFHTAHMATMARVFPSAVFVGIVRHPGAVAASLRKSFHYTFPDALSYWAATNLDMLRAATDLGPRFMACRYEDLVIEPEQVLRELFSCLGESWSTQVLEHHRVQQDKGTPRVVDGHTITRDPVDAKRAANWTQAVTDADYAALQSAAALAGFFGYDVADAIARQPLLPPDSNRAWVPTGDDLARRRRSWANNLDFEARPPTLAIDASVEELTERLSRAERALARVRSRTSVRLSDALRQVQHGRSIGDLRTAWSLLRGPQR